MEKIAVIPAYEPNDKMIHLLSELKRNNYIIIVVNDGSNKSYDNIFRVAKKYATILKHDKNQGKGSALKTAFSYIKNKYSSYCVITIDCDGQHKVSDANKLYEYLINHERQLVIGKRKRLKNTPLRSRIGNSITRFIYFISSGIDVYDTQTGLRAFTNKLMDFMLQIDGQRYEYEMNMLLYCPINNIKIKEIEIETIYYDNNSNSHFSTLKDSYKIYKQIIKFSSISIISFIIDYLLYIFFNISTKKLELSNILSRLISSILNYNLNKNRVFKNKNIILYFIYVICILIINTIMLNIAVNYFSINIYLSKIMIELIIFIVSFCIKKISIKR
ncbi:MAG: glycosyltransferase [Bacilli bacterium]